MNTRYRLHFAPDNASLIIRLALEELALSYDTVLVDRGANGQRSPQYLQLNPNGMIPVLETPNGAIFETAAILLWLADSQNRLIPSLADPRRANFLKWLFWTSNTLHTDLRICFYPERYISQAAEQAAALRHSTQIRLAQHLRLLDQNLAEANALCLGPAPMLLDLYLPCLLRWTALYAQDESCRWFSLTDYPYLHKISALAETRPSTRAAQQAEGLGPTPFTAPQFAIPPEGSAT